MSGAFAFGKLPAHGDFVARGLDDAARAAWDNWATEGLEMARAALGDDFAAAHEQAPPWCFRFGPGRFGDGWRTGALAPSVDRAGRRFILVLGVEGARGAASTLALEDALYRALGEGLTIDETLAAAVLPADDEKPTQGLFWTTGGPAHAELEIASAEPPIDLFVRAFRRIETSAP